MSVRQKKPNVRRKVFWSILLVLLSAMCALALIPAPARNGAAPLVGEQGSRRAQGINQLTNVATRANGPVASSAQNETLPAASSSNDEHVEVEVITVRARGFEPSEITRPRGRFMLAINSQTGLSELSLRLDRVTGNRVQEVRLGKGRIKWSQVLNLSAGDYVLSEANHPEWSCLIKITPQ